MEDSSNRCNSYQSQEGSFRMSTEPRILPLPCCQARSHHTTDMTWIGPFNTLRHSRLSKHRPRLRGSRIPTSPTSTSHFKVSIRRTNNSWPRMPIRIHSSRCAKHIRRRHLSRIRKQVFATIRWPACLPFKTLHTKNRTDKAIIGQFSLKGWETCPNSTWVYHRLKDQESGPLHWFRVYKTKAWSMRLYPALKMAWTT